MTRSLRTRLAQFVGVALALFAGSAVAAALAQTNQTAKRQVVLVIAGKAAENPNILARAKAAAARQHAQLRVAHTNADQLGVTHLFAARGYNAVITVDVDRRIAIAPVAQRYPATRFVETDSNQLDLALSR